MGIVLTFEPSQRSRSAPSASANRKENGECGRIVFFTGVRIERPKPAGKRRSGTRTIGRPGGEGSRGKS